MLPGRFRDAGVGARDASLEGRTPRRRTGPLAAHLPCDPRQAAASPAPVPAVRPAGRSRVRPRRPRGQPDAGLPGARLPGRRPRAAARLRTGAAGALSRLARDHRGRVGGGGDRRPSATDDQRAASHAEHRRRRLAPGTGARPPLRRHPLGPRRDRRIHDARRADRPLRRARLREDRRRRGRTGRAGGPRTSARGSLVRVPAGALSATRCVERLAALGPYRYNWSPGESFDLAATDWLTGERLESALATVAGRRSSGDVYARLDAGPDRR